MKIFALETNVEKAARRFCEPGELPVLVVRYHAFLFFFRVIRQFFLTILMVAGVSAALYFGLPWGWVMGAFAIAWLTLALPGIVRAFVDWRFDALVVTQDHVIILDQTSIFHAEARQLHLENFASVSAATQFWNLFPFGKLYFDLKEGTGERLELAYIPKAQDVALALASTVRNFQRYGGRVISSEPPPAV